jgi:hypothetical protein
MSDSINAWDNDYARLARASSQLRTNPTANSSFNNDASRQSQTSSIHTGINRLDSQLTNLEANMTLTPAEAMRRRNLLDGLRGQLGNTGDGGGISATSAALQHQDAMIDELAVGVGRLKNQTHMIHQETNAHVRLLDEMDHNVDLANQGLEEETRRALRLKGESSVWRLHLIIVGLSVLLFVLILMGLS